MFMGSIFDNLVEDDRKELKNLENLQNDLRELDNDLSMIFVKKNYSETGEIIYKVNEIQKILKNLEIISRLEKNLLKNAIDRHKKQIRKEKNTKNSESNNEYLDILEKDKEYQELIYSESIRIDCLFSWAKDSFDKPVKKSFFRKERPELPYKNVRHAIQISLSVVTEISFGLRQRFNIDSSDKYKLSSLLK